MVGVFKMVDKADKDDKLKELVGNLDNINGENIKE